MTRLCKMIISTTLLALLLAPSGPVYAQDSGLFPRRNKLSRPADFLPDLAPAAGVAAQPQSAPPSGPLRVVIPNIHGEKKRAAKPPAKKAPPAEQAAAATATTTTIRQPAEGSIRPSALNKISQALSAAAQEAWSNGVILADWNNTIMIRTMLKPNIAFSALPLSWHLTINGRENQVASLGDGATIAALAPAAGGDIAKIEPAVVTAQAVPVAPVIRTPVIPPEINEVTAVPPPPPPAAPPQAAAPPSPPAQEASEPAPSLSSQSKAIADKIPAVRDHEPEKPLAKKVDINRKREVSSEVLNAGKVPPANAGIKQDTRGAKFDVNYELERAYNALIAGKSDIAIAIYEDILTGNPKNKEALFGLASTYHRAGQIDMARTLYGKLLAIDPKNRDGLNNFLVLLAEEAPQESLAQMEKLEDQNPEFSPIPAQMAIIYQKLGDTEHAVEKMYRALAIAPENITYRYNLAIMLDKSGKYDQAGKLYTQILDSHAKGQVIPGDATKIQQRLTFIRSNTSK